MNFLIAWAKDRLAETSTKRGLTSVFGTALATAGTHLLGGSWIVALAFGVLPGLALSLLLILERERPALAAQIVADAKLAEPLAAAVVQIAAGTAAGQVAAAVIAVADHAAPAA